jgi:hypothetical protein
MVRLAGKFVHNLLNRTSCRVVKTTASRTRINDPQRRNENEPLLRTMSPDIVYEFDSMFYLGNDTTKGSF